MTNPPNPALPPKAMDTCNGYKNAPLSEHYLSRPEQVTPSLTTKAQKEPALKVMETNLKLKSNGTLWGK